MTAYSTADPESAHEGEIIHRSSSFPRILRTWLGCFGSFMLSITGGLILAWWESNYHSGNHQLWMVPLGLILFITPLMVWSAVIISEFCNSKEPHFCAGSGRDVTPEKPLKSVLTS
ncbi:hypothetical protein F511_30416 [Dorcoceras hygrometricum]|uniref:Uncharacterized protein n=1 Tax=Dorcoceras hygrometricum TaxID=472368 RepID=A0A2Z7DCA6_9LAMI|nr:hypothetical protein F511_30416 [Dorcoceras hygrometricum]